MIVDCISDLLPCPFCNGKNLRVPRLPIISKDFQDFTLHESTVQCLGCGTSGPKSAYVDNVRTAWNERK